ncbi:hypothetical protein N0V95_009358 [Ascochyta clinopodiicola]|nr:hypothetical protein N0V95_009358 [Ascochyta clinopodiicola]
MTSQVASLLDPLQPSTQLAIVEKFWDVNLVPEVSQAYWVFYSEECDRALQDDGRYVLARTVQDVLDAVVSLKADHFRENTRNVLRDKFTKAHPNELELIDRSIDLSATLLLMMDFGSARHVFSGRRRLNWVDGTLRDCVASAFDSTPTLDHKGIKLQRTFSAQSLVQLAGVQLVPTTNLLDHLRLTNNDTQLHVFHHASFLKNQSQGSLLPNALAEETLRTLAILFPQSDVKVRKWYSRLSAPFSLDPELIRCGHLKTEDRQFEKFTYWHDRLIVLKQVFDEATPKTISQWWFDRRNGVQWWTFWVAISVLILTIVFGFIQCITGIMQAYAAFNP